MQTRFTAKRADRNLASLVALCILVFLGASLLQTQRLAAQGEEPPRSMLDEGLPWPPDEEYSQRHQPPRAG